MNYFSILKTTFIILLLSCKAFVVAESVTYKVVKDDNLKYVIKPFGNKPAYSYAVFNNEFGNISGNRYNQIAKDKKAELYLNGWEGSTIKSISFSMCSNAKSGGASVKVMAGNTVLYQMGATAFNSPQWYGAWVSHINYLYVDIAKPMQIDHLVQADEEISIIITGTESSVYINSYTIEYEPGSTPTESALGYQYQRVPNKGTIADGDEILIYFAGLAAGDIDAAQTFPYMDVYPVHDILDVYEPELMYFKLRKNGVYWNLINQYSDTLGATNVSKLAWNSGDVNWTIALTFDGAEISNATAKNGTLRFNAPAASYARFTTYTSTSLPLPYIYKRIKQNEPIKATSLTIPETLTLNLCKDTAIIRPAILPQSATDKRTSWKSSDEAVATVRDGIITPIGVGRATITATTTEGGLSAACDLTVRECFTALNQVKIAGVYSNKGKIMIEQSMPVDIAIYNVFGQLLTANNQVQHLEFAVQKGVYLIKIGKSIMKVAVE